jgi:hypothetical protein
MLVHARKALTPLLAVLLALLSVLVTPARAAEEVDLLLVLAADVSRSVEQPNFQLQRDGYAAALSDRRVLNAISEGMNRRIAVSFVEWSGHGNQKLVIDWMVVSDEKSARAFGAQLAEAPRSFADRTSISGALEFSMAQFERSPFSARRRVIDVSGDGTNNSGRDVRMVRDEIVAQGVTINGLAVPRDRPLPWNPEHTHPPGGLAKYYEDNVIGGPRAFVITADGFEAFGEALIKKLIVEISGLPLHQHATASDRSSNELRQFAPSNATTASN